MVEIDRIQYGRMLQSVETLTKQLEATSRNVMALNERIEDLENRYRFGKGALFGLIFGAAMALQGLAGTIMWVRDKLVG